MKLGVYNIDGTLLRSYCNYADTIAEIAAIGAEFDRIESHHLSKTISMLTQKYEMAAYDITDQPSMFFTKEHTHNDLEIRVILSGSGVFYIRVHETIYKLHVVTGDVLVVPPNVPHWFESVHFSALRLFKSHFRWTANYTHSNIEKVFHERSHDLEDTTK